MKIKNIKFHHHKQIITVITINIHSITQKSLVTYRDMMGLHPWPVHVASARNAH